MKHSISVNSAARNLFDQFTCLIFHVPISPEQPPPDRLNQILHVLCARQSHHPSEEPENKNRPNTGILIMPEIKHRVLKEVLKHERGPKLSSHKPRIRPLMVDKLCALYRVCCRNERRRLIHRPSLLNQ